MGCPSEVEIGDNLVFSVTTHRFDTGVLTDADAVPSYRIYEDETGTAILTGNMAKLDDTNTTGFYSEAIACTSGNGFENGKSYTVYISAAVNSVTGGISYGFKAYDLRKSNAVQISGTSAPADAMEVFFGDATTAANFTATFDGSTGYAFTGCSIPSISGVTFPTNFGSLGINGSGHISRVTLVDTTTTNTDTVSYTHLTLPTKRIV